MSRPAASGACRFRGVLALFLAGFPLAAPTAGRADVGFPARRDLVSLRTQSSFREWTVEDNKTKETTKVRQFATRWFNNWEVREDLLVVLYTSAAHSEVRAADAIELSAVGDVKAKGFWYVWDRRLVVTLGLGLPTGRTNLDESEIHVLDSTSDNALGFRVRNLGEGFSRDVGLAGGIPLTETLTLGGGVGWLARGAYDLDAETEYDAGDELALNAGVDWAQRTLHANLDVVFRMFAEDQWNGEKRFDQGNQIELNLSTSWREGRKGLDVFLRNVAKGENLQREGSGPVAGAPLAESRVKNGNTFWLEVRPMFQPVPLVAVRGLFEYLAANQSQQQAEGGWSMGAGGGVDLRLTDYAIARLQATRLLGRSEDESIERSGFDTVLTLAWQY